MMLMSMPTLILAAALGQAPAPPEAAWLNSVPATAEIIVRIRGAEATRDDLMAMVRAMSPTLADQVEPALNQGVEQMKEQVGQGAAQTPILLLGRVVQMKEGQPPPFAVLIQSDHLAGVLKGFNQGQEPELKPDADGISTIERNGGDTAYVYEGESFAAFGPSKELVAAVAKPQGQSLAEALPKELSERLLGGDLGVYVNVAVLTERYSKEIDAAREQLVEFMKAAGAQAGNAAMMEGIAEFYGRMFDTIKVADGFALNVDFDRAALLVAGEVTLKKDSEAAGRLADAPSGTAAELAKMPADAAYYVYMNVDPELFAQFQKMGMSVLAGDQPNPELEQAMKSFAALGQMESFGASSVADGMRSISVMISRDPKALVEATVDSQEAMKSAKLGENEFIKGVEVSPEAQTHQGYTFTRSKVTFDLEALAATQPNNPAASEMMRRMFGGDTLTTWTGTDGKTVLSVVAPSWEEAQKQIDAYLAGNKGIGATSGYQQIRQMLPDQVSALFLLSAQGLVHQMAMQFSAIFGPQVAVPGDMPQEPALLGGAIATTPLGYQFRLAVPSAVGPVVEKGLVPLFQGLQGQVNQ